MIVITESYLWKIVMKFKFALVTLMIAPLMLTACGKKEEANNADAAQQEQAASTVSTEVTPEQQAAIDAVDQPNLGEDNTDAASEVAASQAQ